jgi:hypothetical protein
MRCPSLARTLLAGIVLAASTLAVGCHEETKKTTVKVERPGSEKKVTVEKKEKHEHD